MRKMKDSGIQWIGQIPEDWSTQRIKYCSSLKTGNSIKDEEKKKYEDRENARPYIATKDIDVINKKANYNNGMFIKFDDKTFNVAPKGSTLMCIEGGSAGKKKTFLTRDVCYVNKLCCFIPTGINDKYLFFCLGSPHFETEFESKISGLIGGVSVSELGNIFVTLPNNTEQTRIANFLDQKCSAIDSVLEKTKSSIEEYKKLKQSVITQAVTKGIRPNRPMKDSGIEWIGQIPEDWVATKIKHISSLVTDGAHVSPETENGIYDFISTVNINNNEIDFESCLKTSESSYKYLVATGCKPIIGDVLISKDGTVGKTVIVKEDREFVVASSLVIIRPQKSIISPDFLNYSLQSKSVQDTLSLLMHGAGLKRVSVAKNANLTIIMPPMLEQQEIVDYLDTKCSEIDNLIAKKEQFLKEIETYKKSLIYEYVTGKKEV